MIYQYSGIEDKQQFDKRQDYLQNVSKQEFIDNEDYLFYIREVQKGNIPVCKLVKNATKRELDKFEKISDPDFPYYFDVEVAAKFFCFCRYFKVLEGSYGNFILSDWQIYVFSMMLGWKKKKDNYRQYQYCYIEVPRGSGKTTMMALFELWMLSMDDEWSPEIYVAATKKDQAKKLLEAALRQVEFYPNKGFMRRLKLERHRENIVCKSMKAGKMVALSRDSKSFDGFNVHCAVVDECHAHPDSSTWDVLNSGANKRKQAMMIGITTAGHNFTGFGYSLSKRAKDIINGREADKWFCCVWTIDKGDDYFDQQVWIKANPGWWYGIEHDKFKEDILMARDYIETRAEALTKLLNVWYNSNDKWLNPDHVHAQKDLSEPESAFVNDECIIGVDLSECEDLTCCVNVYERWNEEDEKLHYYVFPKVWTPEKNLLMGKNKMRYSPWVREGHIMTMPGEIIDLEEIQRHLEGEYQGLNVVEFAFDRYNAMQMAGALQNKFGEQAVYNINQSLAGLNEASKFFNRLLIEGRIHYESPVFEWACLNATVRNHNGLIKVEKDPGSPTEKIDPLIATLNALDRFLARSNMNLGVSVEVYDVN